MDRRCKCCCHCTNRLLLKIRHTTLASHVTYSYSYNFESFITCGQLNGHGVVCIHSCSYKLLLFLNLSPQRGQLNGFSALCILSCSSRLLSFSKLSSQCEQLNGFPTTVYYFMFFHARLNTTMRATECFSHHGVFFHVIPCSQHFWTNHRNMGT